mgnify:CR=1 FL=1
MEEFRRGEIQILVATTVIEVGVDVPNASVMLVEHSERFGLSQLHQLRGRVGRGDEQAYCIPLAGDKRTSDARERLAIMEETSDGFKIAEKDMELRGPGESDGDSSGGRANIPSWKHHPGSRAARDCEARSRSHSDHAAKQPRGWRLIQLARELSEHGLASIGQEATGDFSNGDGVFWRVSI